MNTSSLFWGVIFGAIGMGYIAYGRRQGHAFALLAGVGLCLFPYLVESTFLLIIIGLALMALPFFLE